jgi:hypothetical protein
MLEIMVVGAQVVLFLLHLHLRAIMERQALEDKVVVAVVLVVALLV